MENAGKSVPSIPSMNSESVSAADNAAKPINRWSRLSCLTDEKSLPSEQTNRPARDKRRRSKQDWWVNKFWFHLFNIAAVYFFYQTWEGLVLGHVRTPRLEDEELIWTPLYGDAAYDYGKTIVFVGLFMLILGATFTILESEWFLKRWFATRPRRADDEDW